MRNISLSLPRSATHDILITGVSCSPGPPKTRRLLGTICQLQCQLPCKAEDIFRCFDVSSTYLSGDCRIGTNLCLLATSKALFEHLTARLCQRYDTHSHLETRTFGAAFL